MNHCVAVTAVAAALTTAVFLPAAVSTTTGLLDLGRDAQWQLSNQDGSIKVKMLLVKVLR